MRYPAAIELFFHGRRGKHFTHCPTVDFVGVFVAMGSGAHASLCCICCGVWSTVVFRAQHPPFMPACRQLLLSAGRKSFGWCRSHRGGG